MRMPLQSSGVLDRGGRPTVRDLLSDLVFNPADGTVRLSGDRIVMQRAAFGTELRRALVARLGSEDARAFLMRLGFRSGQSDARFVRRTWPNLDAGDAFTAGTRLHTFSGVVRVETVHNDFDLRRKRFSAEFLWHDSVEAAAFRDGHLAGDPVCWTQIGYASGYASAFFDTLIVYKEVSCAAQGHAHCRVVGKPAEAWGAQDADVALFRERIAAPHGEAPVPSRTAPAPDAAAALDALILAPVKADLDRFAPLPFPVLIVGEAGTGRRRAAQHLHRAANPKGTLRQVCGGQVDLQLCETLARTSGRRGGDPDTVLIDAAGDIPPGVQEPLARAIEAGMLAGGPRVLAILDDRRPQPGLAPGLREALAGLTLRTRPVSDRRGERADLARAVLAVLATRVNRPAPVLDPGAIEAIERHAWPGNLRQMRRVLVTALAAGGGRIDGGLIDKHLRQSDGPTLGGGTREADAALGVLRGWIGAGDFSLAALEAEAYRVAMEQADGNLSAAARLLGLRRAQLAYRLKALAARA